MVDLNDWPLAIENQGESQKLYVLFAYRSSNNKLEVINK